MTVSVTVTNRSVTPWCSAGKFPVYVSYRWIAGSTVLPDEGIRTKLPAQLKGGQSTTVELAIAPPAKPAPRMTIVITAMQEGVAWFDPDGKVGTGYKLPVKFN